MRGESGSGSGRVLATPTAALEITPEGTSFITFVDRPKLARSLAAGTALGVLLTYGLQALQRRLMPWQR